MKNNRSPLNKLLHNNKFLFIAALLISLIVWVYMSMGSSNDTKVTINNIPIQYEMTNKTDDEGLKIFTENEPTATVTVTGNRAILGSVSEKDITVTAATNGITSSGDYNLPVSAAKTNPSANFQINSSVIPSNIKVFVDYLGENTLPINGIINGYKVEENFYAATTLSSNEISISGPQSIISKIKKVSAIGNINDTISSTASTEATLHFYDENDNEVSTKLITMGFNTVEATITVMPEKSVAVKPSYTNKPSDLEITSDMLSINPSNIMIAGPKEVLDKTSYVNLQSIDFTTLRNNKVTFEKQGIDIPRDCKNISNSLFATVTLDFSMLKSKQIDVSSYEVSGLSDKYSAKITQDYNTITVIGPEAEIKNLSAKKIIGIIDTSDFKETTGSVQMPVTFKISDTKSCWVYGSYKANVTINEK